MTASESEPIGALSTSGAEPVRPDVRRVHEAETPEPRRCLSLARAAATAGDDELALSWALRVVDAGDDYMAWNRAARLVAELGAPPPARASARLALLGSGTTQYLTPLLRLAARRRGVDLAVWEAPFNTYRQVVLDPDSHLYSGDFDLVLLAPDDSALTLPAFSEQPDAAVEAEAQRWVGLWETISDRSRTRIVQCNVALPPRTTFGHLGARLPGARQTMAQRLNLRLGELAGERAAIVDCDGLSALVGKDQWFDERYRLVAKQAVSLAALPVLARHAAAVVAADLGLARKCVVVDLDNTLWGGEVGEVGVNGVVLGHGPLGEAYSSFQEFLLELTKKGVIVAVCSKNDDALARSVFERHPDMRLRTDDVAAFAVSWEPKSDGIRSIAASLDLGLDALVFVDDNPAERELVRTQLPEVEVITLPEDPAYYARAVADSLLFETRSYTSEDARRSDSYRGRAQSIELEHRAASLEDFYRELDMHAVLEPFDELHLPRIAQLVGKTNQFNVTTRRHSPAALRAFMEDPSAVTMYARLRDRFTDHGLVAVLIAIPDGSTLEIDSWLMSCRVIGRTLERSMLDALVRAAIRNGCTTIRGTYLPTERNGLVVDLYPRLGFRPCAGSDESTSWALEVAERPANEFIDIQPTDPGSP